MGFWLFGPSSGRCATAIHDLRPYLPGDRASSGLVCHELASIAAVRRRRRLIATETTEVIGLAWCLPADPGMASGHPLYYRLDDTQFQPIVLLLLLIMGGMFVADTLSN